MLQLVTVPIAVGLTNPDILGTLSVGFLLDDALAAQLRAELEAVERAEQRLEDGNYGFSVESGEPIPDDRLEAYPLAERTVEEERRFERGL